MKKPIPANDNGHIKLASLQLVSSYRFRAGVTSDSPSLGHSIEKFDMTLEPANDNHGERVRVVRVGFESKGEDFIPLTSVVGYREL